MYNLENFLAINKKNYNTNPTLTNRNSDLKLYDRLQVDFDFSVSGDLTVISESTLDHLKNTPKFLRDWQADDMRRNQVGNYYQNPLNDYLIVIIGALSVIIGKITVWTWTGEESIDGEPVENRESACLPIPGTEKYYDIMQECTKATETYKIHTDRLSNVVPVGGGSDASSTDPAKMPDRPHYLTCMATNRVLEYIIYQADGKTDTETILSCFTALLTKDVVEYYTRFRFMPIADAFKLIPKTELPTCQSNPISGAQEGTPLEPEAAALLLTPEIKALLDEIYTSCEEFILYTRNRYSHDCRVWQNIKEIMKEYEVFRVMQGMGETQKKLVKDYIGTDKLNRCLALDDLPPTKWNVNVDYYGSAEYTIVPQENVLPPNTNISIIDDYINYYNVANQEIYFMPDYTLDINPRALVFNTLNGVWSNTRTVTITNTGNNTYILNGVGYADFNSSECDIEVYPKYTKLLLTGEQVLINVRARGMITGNTEDYGIVQVIPGIDIQTKVTSNDAIIPCGVLLPSNTISRFGQGIQLEDKLIINANNGPYPILSNAAGELAYTWINPFEYPVTISTVENITDANNLSDLTIELYSSSNTSDTLNVASGITLNTAQSVLWYANVSPHLYSPNTAIYKISTTDGQERLMYIGVYGGDNGISPDGTIEPVGYGVNDESLYNEIVSVDPPDPIYLTTGLYFKLVITGGKPKTKITYYGPNVSGRSTLDATGNCTIQYLVGPDGDQFHTYGVNFLGTGHTRTLIKWCWDGQSNDPLPWI